MTPEQAIIIANAIADDIRDRRGIGDELENIDEDTKAEMLMEWVRLILRNWSVGQP